MHVALFISVDNPCRHLVPELEHNSIIVFIKSVDLDVPPDDNTDELQVMWTLACRPCRVWVATEV